MHASADKWVFVVNRHMDEKEVIDTLKGVDKDSDCL
jgi:hypothetical protein